MFVCVSVRLSRCRCSTVVKQTWNSALQISVYFISLPAYIEVPSVLVPSVLWRCWLGSRRAYKKLGGVLGWGGGAVICLEQGADSHMAQLMPMPLTVSCFSKIQIGFTFLVAAVCVCLYISTHRVSLWPACNCVPNSHVCLVMSMYRWRHNRQSMVQLCVYNVRWLDSFKWLLCVNMQFWVSCCFFRAIPTLLLTVLLNSCQVNLPKCECAVEYCRPLYEFFCFFACCLEHITVNCVQTAVSVAFILTLYCWLWICCHRTRHWHSVC